MAGGPKKLLVESQKKPQEETFKELLEQYQEELMEMSSL